MNTPMTNIHVADATIQLFDFLKIDKKGWALFEKLYGIPFDIRVFTPDDYVFSPDDTWKNWNRWVLNIGNGWTITLRSIKDLNPTNNYGFSSVFYLNGNYCGGVTFSIVNGAIKLSNPLREAESAWRDIFATIKRRAAATIREHEKYLTNPVFYDTLKTELNIKIRKKK